MGIKLATCKFTAGYVYEGLYNMTRNNVISYLLLAATSVNATAEFNVTKGFLLLNEVIASIAKLMVKLTKVYSCGRNGT